MNLITRSFDSFAAFLDAANGDSPLLGSQRSSRGSEGYQCREKASDSYFQACCFAINGVPDIEAKIKKIAEDLDIPGRTNAHPDLYFDVSGQSVNMDLYLSHEVDCMENYELAERNGGQVVSISINASCGASRAASEIIRRGAAVCALIDAIESAGYRAEVTVVSTNSAQHGSTEDVWQARVIVKGAAEVLDLTRLAYSLAHPSMLRRHMFSLRETENMAIINKFGFKNSRNYGYPADLPESTDLYLGQKDWWSFSSDQAAAEWLRETLKTLQVTE